MAPAVQDFVMVLAAFLLVLAIVLAVRKTLRDDMAKMRDTQVRKSKRREFWEDRHRPHDVPFLVGPLESLSEAPTEILPLPLADADEGVRAPLGNADLRRIVGAMVVETCEARELVRKAQHTLSMDDYGEMLVGAEHRLHQVIGCLGGLLERCDATKEGES